MKQKAYRVFPAALVVVMVAFLSLSFLATANSSFAATAKKKVPEAARTSAVDHTEARIKLLHSALKITKDQQESWHNLTQVMRENATNMDALTKDRAENKKSMNTVEYMKYQSLVTDARSEQLKKLIPPFEAFYAGLSDDQKTIVDALFRTGKHGKHKMN